MSADKRAARKRLGLHSRAAREAEILRRASLSLETAGRLRKIAAGLPWWRVLGRRTLASEAQWYQREGDALLAEVKRIRAHE